MKLTKLAICTFVSAISFQSNAALLCDDDLLNCTQAPQAGDTLVLNSDGKTFSLERSHSYIVGEVKMFELPTKAPENCLALNGQTIYADEWPELVSYYSDDSSVTSVQLRDYRGEFLRGLDEGRGVDEGRLPRSWQGDMLKSHNHRIGNSRYEGNVVSTQYWGDRGGSENQAHTETSYTGGHETRPRNEAIHYCVIAGKKNK